MKKIDGDGVAANGVGALKLAMSRRHQRPPWSENVRPRAAGRRGLCGRRTRNRVRQVDLLLADDAALKLWWLSCGAGMLMSVISFTMEIDQPGKCQRPGINMLPRGKGA
jgi:hypothetical protein